MAEYAEFRARDFRRIARDKLRGRWGLPLAVTLVASLLGGYGGATAGASFSGGYNLSSYTGIEGELPAGMEAFLDGLKELLSNPFVLAGLAVGLIIGFIIGIGLSFVGAAVSLGHWRFYIDLCNNHNPNFGTLFSRFKIFWKAVGLIYFISLFVFLWSLLFVVPGIIASYRYALAPFIMAQNPEKGVRQCVNESKELMRGHKGRLFCLRFSFIGWVLLGVLSFGIANLWINPYMCTAYAAFYMDRTGQGIPLNPEPEPQP